MTHHKFQGPKVESFCLTNIPITPEVPTTKFNLRWHKVCTDMLWECTASMTWWSSFRSCWLFLYKYICWITGGGHCCGTPVKHSPTNTDVVWCATAVCRCLESFRRCLVRLDMFNLCLMKFYSVCQAFKWTLTTHTWLVLSGKTLWHRITLPSPADCGSALVHERRFTKPDLLPCSCFG